jgi:hypothetical protein
VVEIDGQISAPRDRPPRIASRLRDLEDSRARIRKKQEARSRKQKKGGSGGGGGGSGIFSGKKCHNCGGSSHLAKECPKPKASFLFFFFFFF